MDLTREESGLYVAESNIRRCRLQFSLHTTCISIALTAESIRYILVYVVSILALVSDMLVISGRRILLKHLCDRISSNTCNEDKLVVVN